MRFSSSNECLAPSQSAWSVLKRRLAEEDCTALTENVSPRPACPVLPFPSSGLLQSKLRLWEGGDGKRGLCGRRFPQALLEKNLLPFRINADTSVPGQMKFKVKHTQKIFRTIHKNALMMSG